MSSKRLLLYAADTYRLSSLLVRRVILTRPATPAAYGEKARQLLLDESRPASSPSSSANAAAVKLLEWDRELNLIRYYGPQEYAKRWWASISWSSSLFPSIVRSTGSSSGGGGGGAIGGKRPGGDQQQPERDVISRDEKNVARVAFMITSKQRHQLSTELGYSSRDIRTFKPIEALLLLEHGVKKEVDGGGGEHGDFRVKLKELVEENDRLSKMQHQKLQSKAVLEASVGHDQSVKEEEGGRTRTTNIRQSISPEEAQRVHAKPDVAMALLSVDEDKNNRAGEHGQAGTDVHDEASAFENNGENIAVADIDSTDMVAYKQAPAATVDIPSPATPSLPAVVNVTPHDSEELHMQPDVTEAILMSQQQKSEGIVEHQIVGGDDGEVDDDEQCWYEVVERLPAAAPAPSAVGGDGTRSQGSDAAVGGEQVMALFPTKEEALECVRIKQSFGRRGGAGANADGEGSGDDRFIVRRRWNA